MRDFPFKRTRLKALMRDYASLSARQPVSKVRLSGGGIAYVVSRFDDIQFVLSDSRFSRQVGPKRGVRPGPVCLGPLRHPPGSLLTLDPPAHTRLRTVIEVGLSERRIDTLSPRIQEATDQLLDAMARSQSPVDCNNSLAFPLPLMVICDLLSVPAAERYLFHRWADSSAALTRDPSSERRQLQELAFYLANHIEKKQGSGADDLLGALMDTRGEFRKLSHAELIGTAMSLLLASLETTGGVIGFGILFLLRNPQHIPGLSTQNVSIEAFFEELLRHSSMASGSAERIALVDVKIGKSTIPKGSTVIAWLASGNFDDAHFASPMQFRTDRASDAQLIFGHGVHGCVGAPLARVMFRVAITSLFARFPTLRLAVDPDRLTICSRGVSHRLEELPVSW